MKLTFKAKLRRIGNSVGILIPYKVITSYKVGDEIVLKVITKEQKQGFQKDDFTTNVITKTGENKKFSFNTKKGVWE